MVHVKRAGQVRLGLWGAFLCCGGMVVVGCGAEDAGPAKTDAPEQPGEQVEAIGDGWVLQEYDGRYDGKTGKIDLVLREAPKLEGWPGLAPRAHQTVPDGAAANQIQFITENFSEANTTCGGFANSFCANVSLRSHFTKRVNLTWVQISGLSTGVTIRNPDPIPSALAGYVTGPAYNYGTLSPGIKSTKQWVFGVPNANNFTFTATVKAFPARTAYSVALRTGVFVNACTTGTTVLPENSYDAVAAVNLPFPMTVYDSADITGTVTARGVFYLGTNKYLASSSSALPTAGTLPRGSIAPFWDTLRTRPAYTPPSGRVCTLAVGTRPTRQYYVTWENMRFQGEDGIPQMTFTMRYIETTDSITFYYLKMGNPVEPISRTRGAKATAGLLGHTPWSGPCTDANVCKQLFSRSEFLPATSSGYPISYVFSAL